MEFTDNYEFGKVMFNGSTPVMKNNERAACVKNLDMIEPSEIQGADGIGGRIIKTPCIKQCMALKEGVATHKESGLSKKIYVMSCIEKGGFIEIKESETKASNTRSLIL